jgi:putative nucleotidyltransferase with HDIG domain
LTVEKQGILLRLEKVENLPTLPVVVQQIQKLMASQSSSMAQIGAVIARDQAITARVIRLINSAFYGLGSRITSIPQAIVLLGLNTVKNLITGVSVVKMFAGSGSASLFDREQFWLHSMACAMGARMLAKNLGRSEPEDYFLAGLLHDIGVIVLDQYFHEEFIAVLHHAVRERIDYYAAEGVVLETTHGHVGEAVAVKWRIPGFLVHAIRNHHEPAKIVLEAENSRDIIAVVHIADVAANNAGLHMGFSGGRQVFHEQALRSTGVKNGVVDEVFVAVVKEVRSLAAEWGI